MVTVEQMAERLEEIANDLRREEKAASATIERKKENDEDFQFDMGVRTGYRSSIGRISDEITELLTAY